MAITDKYYGLEPSINNHSFIDYPSEDDCLTIFFTGCEHNCKNCQNKELQKTGKVYVELEFDEFVERMTKIASRLRTKKIVLQGGDPLHPQNKEFTKMLLENYSYRFDFCVYTGYEYEKIKDFVKYAKFTKCGKFDEAKFITPEKTDEYFQLASSNQKIYKDGILVSKNGRIDFD